MTTRAEIEALIKTLEEAKEGSRVLDARIGQAFTGIEYAAGWGPSLPYYTTNVDAALTLVPEGWFVERLGEHVSRVIYRGDKHEHIAHSLPLALCIAALRARLSDMKDDANG